jgi:hypothetical protein
MRRGLSIAKATALEILSEPLSLLLLLAALTITTLAPAFHYHQFGEPSRMARDAGFSALFTCGILFAVLGSIKSIRREIDVATIQMALSHPVSRGGFFCAKVTGAFAAYLVFAAIVSATALTIVSGAEIGGRIAAKSGDVAKLWGPALAAGVGTLLLPLAVAAALNRFARFRFTISAFGVATACAAASAVFFFDAGIFFRMLAVFVLIAAFSAVFLAAASAFAVKMKTGHAACAAGILFAAALPAAGNYYLPDALRNGASVPWEYVAAACAGALPALVLFILLGAYFLNGRDIT